MSLLGEDGATTEAPVAPREYDVLKQRVDLDVDFASRSLKGSTEISIQPLSRDLREIRLHCRQCRPTLVQTSGITAKFEYFNAYRRAGTLPQSKVYQHDMLKSRLKDSLQPSPDPQLIITLPKKLKIQELKMDPGTAELQVNGISDMHKQEAETAAVVETPVIEKLVQQGPQFALIKLTVEFEVDKFRDGIHWVGCHERDKRYPHFYTKLEPWPGNTSSIFPCLDDANSRCSWELAIHVPRTLGDAFRKPKAGNAQPSAKPGYSQDGDMEMVNGLKSGSKPNGTANMPADEFIIDLDEQDAALDLTVVCIGDLIDDVGDTEDDSRHTLVFGLENAVAARHVGFAVGPFEQVDLTASRNSEEESKLGTTAVKVVGYCLPGRSEELDNTCFPICQALDSIGISFGTFPFKSYQMLFVDDMVHDTTAAAGLSICNNQLLFPQDIIEPLDQNTRILVRAVAEQWSGVNVIPKEASDNWVTAAIAGYLTDTFMRHLSGNNQYRWEQKLASEKVYDLDVDRPSIHQLGKLLHLDHSIIDFLNLKSALVLGILDRRLLKTNSATGVTRIISRIFLNAKTGSLVNGELSTSDFQRTCERLGHNKLESFFRQWILGSGCPIFQCTQRFNKKKLVVEMKITQRQLERQTKPAFEPGNFMREVKEHVQEVWAPEPQAVFTGPMTIRIHEADGTPYEHIVEIKEAVTMLEIPYNTKYKRLKRSKRQKERALAEGNAAGEGDESLLYCLGDILDTPEEVKAWNLEDWSAEDEEKMGQESYEWIRMDADFEWIGKIHLTMPLYMYISQLQQDRDLVAQYESMRYLLGSNPHHVSLSILVRTLMDDRYFYGIRVMAAEGLGNFGRTHLMEIGKHHLTKAFVEMFCENDVMPRPNDFSNRITLILQCAIPKAMTQLRDAEGKVPKDVRQFYVDKLRFNDNSDNSFSDCHYVATLMSCLADSLVVSHRIIQPVQPAQQTYEFAFDNDEPAEPEEPEEPINPDADFEEMAINEIERYRRIDEWILTYQNVYSTTAIECLQKLTKAGIVKGKNKEILQYTRTGCADNVRLEAFRCLNEIGLTKKMTVMKYLVQALADDPSPFFRNRMLRLFGEALGHIALGDDETDKAQAAPAPTEGLILEQEVSNETRRIEAMRKLTPEGALAALKLALKDDEEFQQMVWYAATSPGISLDEIAAFCDIAALVFDPSNSLTVTLLLPRPYRCEHEGHGKIRFYHNKEGAYRTTPSKDLALEDFEVLEKLGLQYLGPRSKEIGERVRRDTEAQLKAGQRQPTLPTPRPPSATPTEKTGIKLTLGSKRKASVDFGPQGEPLSKPIKVSKSATPGTASRKASQMGPKPVRPVVIKLSRQGSTQAQEIMSSPPQPGRISARSPNPASYPLSVQLPRNQMSSSGVSGPRSSFALTPQPPTLNLGGFRSFGPTPVVAPHMPLAASPVVESPHATSASPAATNGFAGSPPSSLTGVTSLTSISPPARGDGSMPPPKKKFTLKLGPRPGQNSTTPGSNQGTPPA